MGTGKADFACRNKWITPQQCRLLAISMINNIHTDHCSELVKENIAVLFSVNYSDFRLSYSSTSYDLINSSILSSHHDLPKESGWSFWHWHQNDACRSLSVVVRIHRWLSSRRRHVCVRISVRQFVEQIWIVDSCDVSTRPTRGDVTETVSHPHSKLPGSSRHTALTWLSCNHLWAVHSVCLLPGWRTWIESSHHQIKSNHCLQSL